MSAAMVEPPRKRFTREEVRRMQDAGLFAGQRYELIEGDLIDKMGQKPPHANTIRRVHTWLVMIFGPERVQIQLPIDVAPGDRERNEPEPDLAVLREHKSDYEKRHPAGSELILLIEVADTTATFDLSAKAMLYARAGVPEYWVMDIKRRVIVVHTCPSAGGYKEIRRVGGDDSIAPLAAPAAWVRVGKLIEA